MCCAISWLLLLLVGQFLLGRLVPLRELHRYSCRYRTMGCSQETASLANALTMVMQADLTAVGPSWAILLVAIDEETHVALVDAPAHLRHRIQHHGTLASLLLFATGL